MIPGVLIIVPRVYLRKVDNFLSMSLVHNFVRFAQLMNLTKLWTGDFHKENLPFLNRQMFEDFDC